jgi:hypothetical protein
VAVISSLSLDTGIPEALRNSVGKTDPAAARLIAGAELGGPTQAWFRVIPDVLNDPCSCIVKDELNEYCFYTNILGMGYWTCDLP